MDNHPNFPNPTIAEVVCEVHFALPGAASLHPRFVRLLERRIKDDYPDVEQMSKQSFQFGIGPQGLHQRLLPPQPQTRFTHKSQPLLLQLAPNLMTFNVLKPYPGWEKVRTEFVSAWQQVRHIVRPTSIGRVGLRYINLIDRETEHQPARDWLRSGQYIPPGTLESRPGFLLRNQVQLSDVDRLIVTLGDGQAETDKDVVPILFDIDRIVEKKFTTRSEQLLVELDRLHEDVWHVFSSAQTPKLQSLLQQEEDDANATDR